MHYTLLHLGALLHLAAQANAPDPVFDLKAILAPALQARTLKSTEKDGIVTEGVMFHSETDGGKKVDIFAFFSYPKGAKKLPAFIWNQGGLAQASDYWTVFGAKRGYAALCIDFPMPGYRSTGDYPIVSGLELPDDPKKAPIYHGAVALLRAVSYLQSRPEVDKDKIGMVGSSWGGFYTTLMAGVDPRLKAASSMFGCGFLQQGNVWWDGQGLNKLRTADFRKRWSATLDPAARLSRAKIPYAVFTGTNDTFYWLMNVSNTIEAAAGPKNMTLLPNWNHALTPVLDEQVFAWLDVHLKGAPGFLEIIQHDQGYYLEQGVLDGKYQTRWRFRGPRRAIAAELSLSHSGPGNWTSRYWKTYPAKIQGDTCVAALPGGRYVNYYMFGTVIDDKGFRYSTPVSARDLTRVPADHGKPDFDFNGCDEWGGFEQRHQQYIQLHGYPMPALSDDAKEGKKAALFKEGTHTLPPILFCRDLNHRFSAYLKADKETKVTLQLAGTFDGKKQTADKAFTVGPKWTEIALDFQPPYTLTAELRAQLSVPKGATVLIDDVRLRPNDRRLQP